MRRSPNAELIGIPGSRKQLATPCLLLDHPRLIANLATAANFAKASSIALRPHGKSHKCVEIARLQQDAGAVGLCVATVGEAEAFAFGGVTNLLITSNLTQPSKLARVVQLATDGCKIAVVVDDPDMVDRLGKVAREAGVELDALIDVDLGRKRNGVQDAPQALAVAARIKAQPALRLAGMQTYASHISHVENYAERLAANRAAADKIASIRTALESAGYPIASITGGSTGTLFMDPSLGCYTELQAGSYVFNDVEYLGVDLDGEHGARFAPSLFVAVSVIGRNVPGRVTCDGGNKHFSAKGTLPAFERPPVPGAIYRPDSDEHGIIELPEGAPQPALGSQLELIVPHCDPTVNLYDHLHVVEGDTLVDIWAIEGRGAF